MEKVREGYNINKIGEIPCDWKVDKLGDKAYIKARIGWRGLSSDEYTDEGPYLVAGKHIKGSEILWDECDHISIERYNESSEIMLREKDIIMTKDGTIGRVGFIDKLNNKATINGTMMLIRPNEEVFYSKFLYYYFQGENFKKIINEKVSGSSIPHIFQRDMVNLEVPIPYKYEQEKIASILSTVDEQINNVDVIIEKNKELKRGLMQTLLTKGIGHTKFKKTEVGEIPDEWEVMKLKEICNIKIGGTPSRNELSYWDYEKKYKNKWISIKDLSNCNKYIYDTNEYITELGINNSNVKMLEPKTVIMSFKLSIGKMAITTENMYTNEAIAGFTELNDNVYYGYLYYIIPFLKYDIDIAVKGSTLNKEKLNNTLIALPIYNEQIKISSILSELDEKIENYDQKKQKLELVKKGLIQQLLTGCIRVN